LFGLILGGGLYALIRFIGWEGAEGMVSALKLILLSTLYVYCYGLTAVLLRITLMRSHLRPNGTWLLALLLVGLGSVGPYLFAYFFDSEALRYRARKAELWDLTNPFASINNRMEHLGVKRYLYTAPSLERLFLTEQVFDTPCLSFLVIWGVVVTALCLPWGLGQVARFCPPDREEESSPRRERAPPVTVEPEDEPPVAMAELDEAP